MKRIFTTLLSLAFIGLTLNGLLAQEAESVREIRLKLKTNENGVETTIDTTITLLPGQDPQEVIESLGLDVPMEQTGVFRMKFDEQEGDEVELLLENELDVDVEQLPDGSMKVTINRDGETQVIEGAADGNWTTDDGATVIFGLEDASFSEGTEVKVIHLGEGDAGISDVEVVGEGENRRVIINRNGEVEEIPIGEDAVWMEESEDVHIIRMGSEEEGDTVEIHRVQMIRVEIKIEDPEEEDMEMLRDAGASDLNNSLQLEELSFYPNPSNGQVHLEFQAPEEGPLSVSVRDLQGRMVYEETTPEFAGFYQQDIDISGESAGVYFLTITVNGNSVTKKLVME